MKNIIKFIGTGGAFDYNIVNSSAIININDNKVLIDCGHSVFPELMKLNIADKIDAIIITHLHDDHIGSLSTLLFYNKLVLNRTIQLWLPEKFINEVKNFLSIPMQSPENFAQFIPLETIKNITPIDTYGKHLPEFQTWAYLFYINNKNILYSGDINDIDFLINKIKELNINPDIIFCDISFYQVPAHVYYKEAEKYLKEFNIYGYHHNHLQKPKDCKIPLVAESKYKY